MEHIEKYLKPSHFIQSDHPAVLSFVNKNTSENDSDKEKAVALFYAVRDEIIYSPEYFSIKKEFYYPAVTLHNKASTCVPKAALLCAALRAAGIPSKMGYADVTNHIISPKILDLLGGKIFLMHGFSQVFLKDRWIKVTPTFNASLCTKMNVEPLNFDGENDCIFQQFNGAGNKHMEYLQYHPEFEDVPYEFLTELYLTKYPKLCQANSHISFDFYNNLA